MKLLILGGYGVFGGRLAELICDVPEICLLIAGRSAAKAEGFCASLEAASQLIALQVDRNDIESALRKHKPDVLVDASGPFQEYGTNPYHVVECCIRHRVNYLDLADGSDFVFGIGQFDSAAKEAGVFVLSGVSSFPVLTTAVIREFGKTINVQNVVGGVAPSPYAGIGLNVMRAVLGYAGGPITLTRNGVVSQVAGLTESMRYTIAPPGRLPLRNLHFSLVDVPDLMIIPCEFPGISDVWMGAGPVPEILHRTLNLLARLRARFGLSSFAPLSSLCYWLLNHLRFGEDRGGMFIEVRGQRGTEKVTQSWHLLAEGSDGPYIPSMAIEIIIRKILDGNRPATGSRPATNEITLADYNRVFLKRAIASGLRDTTYEAPSPFARVLGSLLSDLPTSIVDFHSCEGDSQWQGRATVTAASNPLAKLVARIFRFPTTGGSTPVNVSVTRKPDREIWRRQFDRAVFHSELTLGQGRDEFLICERFGLITVALAIVWDDDKLFFVPRRWRVGPIPLPKYLLPRGRSFESDEDGEFAFNVELAAPVVGRIVAYQGTLTRTR